MKEKNDVEVIINNKRYTLCGYESGEYLQRVATYINNKYSEFKLQEAYNSLDADMKNVLLAINIADDYFKAQKQVDELQADNETKDKEIFDMKHEFISLQTRMESSERKLEETKERYEKAEKDIVRLETELKQKSDGNTGSRNGASTGNNQKNHGNRTK